MPKNKKKWTHEQIPELRGKIAIVTGANTGLGLATTRALARKHATVIMACRNTSKGQAEADRISALFPTSNVKVMSLDLSDLKSVRTFAKKFIEKYTALHLLINNAGVMMPPLSKTKDGFELQFGTNHLGHFALTGLLLGLLNKTKNARVVSVSSMAHQGGKLDFDDLQWEKRPYDKMRSYGDSKIANLYFTYELQERLRQAGKATLAVAAHPGWTATDLQRYSGLFRFFNPLFAQKPEQGSWPTLYGATAADVRGADYFGPEGFMEIKGHPKKVSSSQRSQDKAIAARLWDVSEKLTGVKYTI